MEQFYEFKQQAKWIIVCLFESVFSLQEAVIHYDIIVQGYRTKKVRRKNKKLYGNESEFCGEFV